MSIVVIRRPREDERSKTGLGRYADSVEDTLEKDGCSYSVVEADLVLANGFFHGIRDGFFTPLKQSRRLCRDNSTVVHATDELCGVFFPFIHGKRILTLHHVVKSTEGRGRLYNIVWNLVTRVAVRYADEIVAVSPNTAEAVMEAFNPKVPVRVIFNKPSVDYRRDDSIAREPLVGVVAELISRKNVIGSIRAFDILARMDGMDNLRMVICGQGMEKDNLVQAVENAGLAGRVDFVDSLTDTELQDLYNRMSVLFNTSLHEGVGMVSLEANLCGTPVLCLKDADIPPEVTAASVKCVDNKDLAVQAYRLLTDSEYYSEVSQNSIAMAVKFGEGFTESMRSLYGFI